MTPTIIGRSQSSEAKEKTKPLSYRQQMWLDRLKENPDTYLANNNPTNSTWCALEKLGIVKYVRDSSERWSSGRWVLVTP